MVMVGGVAECRHNEKSATYSIRSIQIWLCGFIDYRAILAFSAIATPHRPFCVQAISLHQEVCLCANLDFIDVRRMHLVVKKFSRENLLIEA